MITVQGLTKRYARTLAVDHISFEVQKGQIVGFLGPNGAGKTTTMRILTCFLPPSEGTATVAGFDVLEQPLEVKKRIGYLPESPPVYPEMDVEEYLTFVGRLKGMSGASLANRVTEVAERCAIADVRKKLIGKLSKGYRQRVGLAQAIIHNPDVLILDEPTAGIDPVARRALWDLLFQLSGQGVTFFVTTHYMDEAERCGRVGYIYLSKLIAIGTVEELQKLPEANPAGTSRVQIDTANPSAMLDTVRGMAGVREATIFGRSIHALAETEGLGALRAQLPQARVETIEPSLEDVFVTLTYQIMEASR